MAIGSEGEIGASFKSCREYTLDDWQKWWEWMRSNWGNHLMNGYSTLVHKKDNRYYRKEQDG